jgi:hypothetical protein
MTLNEMEIDMKDTFMQEETIHFGGCSRNRTRDRDRDREKDGKDGREGSMVDMLPKIDIWPIDKLGSCDAFKL